MPRIAVHGVAQALGPTAVTFAEGPAFEAAVRGGGYAGALDLSVADVAGDRLTAAGAAGIPQVVVAAGLEGLAPAELDRLGREVAWRLSAARGPTVLIIPAGVPVFAMSVRQWAAPSVEVIEDERSAGDPALAASAARRLAELLGG